MMTAVSPAAEPSSSSSPAKQHERAGWQWQCPACSNRQRTGPGLLQHMQKCCGDLLPSTYSTTHIKSLLAAELQRQQHTQPHASTHQPGGDSDIQAVVTAACQQEHTLRMRALHLRFIDDGKQPSSSAAAAVEAGGGTDDEEEPPDTTPTPQELPVELDSVSPSSSSSSSQQPAVSRKRGRQRSAGRTPVRSIEQVMQEMQLPKTRVLRLLERAPRSIKLVSDSEPLQVVHEDTHFLAVSKPPGLRSAPVHRFLGGSVVNRMIGHLGTEPCLLHRIDMNTSGVLVAAKDSQTASLVAAQFRTKQVSKAYLALCLGVPQQQAFTLDGPIDQHPAVKVARCVAAGGQPAATHVQVLAVSSTCPQDVSSSWGPAAAADPAARVKGVGCCLVCCRPVTGRTHQIRVHMAHAGHPLLADDVYGLMGPWMSRQALHAVSLTLLDPHSGQPLTFVAPPPDDFAAAAAALGLTVPNLEDLRDLSAQHYTQVN